MALTVDQKTELTGYRTVFGLVVNIGIIRDSCNGQTLLHITQVISTKHFSYENFIIIFLNELFTTFST